LAGTRDEAAMMSGRFSGLEKRRKRVDGEADPLLELELMRHRTVISTRKSVRGAEVKKNLSERRAKEYHE
jgi:hypothetical protein